MIKNILCTDADLRNEAGVETFFMARMLNELLGYKDANIRLKETIETLSVNAGRRRVLYRPDFAITKGGHVRWVCDAKSPTEGIEKWRGQCKSYCHELNERYGPGENPVLYYMLTKRQRNPRLSLGFK